MGLFDFLKKKRIDETVNQTTKVEEFGACMKKGKDLYDTGKYDKAVIWLKQAIEIEPQWAAGPYHVLGLIYQNRKEYDTAIDYFEKSNELEPHHANYYQIGVIYQAFAKKCEEKGAPVEAYEWLLKSDNLFEKVEAMIEAKESNK